MNVQEFVFTIALSEERQTDRQMVALAPVNKPLLLLCSMLHSNQTAYQLPKI